MTQDNMMGYNNNNNNNNNRWQCTKNNLDVTTDSHSLSYFNQTHKHPQLPLNRPTVFMLTNGLNTSTGTSVFTSDFQLSCAYNTLE